MEVFNRQNPLLHFCTLAGQHRIHTMVSWFTGAISSLISYKISGWTNEQGETVPAENPNWPYGNLLGFDATKQKGDIYTIWDGTVPIVVISNPKDVETFYKSQALHTRRDDACMGSSVSFLMHDCVGVLVGDAHHKVARLLKNHFTPAAIDRKADLIHQQIIKWAEEHATDTTIESAEIFDAIPFQVVSRFVYGDSMSEENLQALKDFCGRFGALLGDGTALWRRRMDWLLQYFPSAHRRELQKFIDDWYAWNREMAKLNEDSVVAKLLKDENCSEAFVFNTMSEIIFTNIEITAATSSWLVYQLASHPEWQEGLRNTMKDGKNGYSALKDNAMLTASIRESGRIRPGVMLTIPEISHKEIVLGGYKIPGGTLVSLDVAKYNSHKDLWDESNTEYNPQVFLDEKIGKTKFHMFGVGNRQCAGQYLAYCILRCLVYELVGKRTLTLESEAKPFIPSAVGLPFFASPARFPLIKVSGLNYS